MLDAAILVAFLITLVVIGRWASGRVHSSLDFHLAGRRLGVLPVTLSLAATEFNGSGLVGGAGLAYTVGIAGVFWNFSAVPAWIILAFTVAVAFRKLALYTVPEFLGDRYNSRARRLASLSQLASGVIFLAVQILVSTLALSTLLGVPKMAATVAITAIFVLYTYSGGLLAVVWTDVACYFVLMAAVVIGAPLALHHAGGIAGLHQALPPESFDIGRLGIMEPLAWVALCFFSYGTDQAYLQRVFAARKASTARIAYTYTGLNYLVFGGAVALLGMSAAALLPDLAQHDEALPALIKHIFPPGVRGLFLTGIVAATMSTSSSFLAAGSSLFAKDIYEPLLGRGSSEQHLLKVSRLATDRYRRHRGVDRVHRSAGGRRRGAVGPGVARGGLLPGAGRALLETGGARGRLLGNPRRRPWRPRLSFLPVQEGCLRGHDSPSFLRTGPFDPRAGERHCRLPSPPP